VNTWLTDVKKECCPLHHYVSWEREMKNAEYIRGDAFRKCNVSLVCKSTNSTWAKQSQTYIQQMYISVWEPGLNSA
jgi:hypothetical protein